MVGEPDNNLIPITLLTGFLGSGKTTLLNHLVNQPELSNALVIINEFGEMALDHQLVAHSTENLVMEMSSGCLCCSIRGDLVKTLKDIFWRFSRNGEKQFDRILIETTGLADPAPIIQALVAHPQIAQRYRLDGIVTTIDLSTAQHTLDQYDEAKKQAAMADLLLLTKGDLVSSAERTTIQQRLKHINPAAQHIDVLSGEVEPSQVLNLGLFSTADKDPDVERWLNEEAYPTSTHSHAHEHEHGHDDHVRDVNRHDDHIRAFCFAIDEPLEMAAFDLWLQILKNFVGERILRLKGIINIKELDKPIVIHGVQHTFFPPAMLPAWPSEDRRSCLVFIADNVDPKIIEATLNSLKNPPAHPLEIKTQGKPK